MTVEEPSFTGLWDAWRKKQPGENQGQLEKPLKTTVINYKGVCEEG